ncbi:hypothetical protein PVL30_003990 [Lodderomyces elongisporus]|uniref:uncharacterized protein n=1 Tax=Lodderomyces elongisporus TaxID=36914 RepID=UPI0029209D66|nr:uncharacterized protein PVL30_003990 [Lodderomyces elongisporus]WLF80214.1 hypothetical protein PVL30_003990 [Lodderomyces elongisporus]
MITLRRLNAVGTRIVVPKTCFKQFHYTSRRQFNPIVENFLNDLKEEGEDDKKSNKSRRLNSLGNNDRNDHNNERNNNNNYNDGEDNGGDSSGRFDRFKSFLMKCLETIGITISSVGILAGAGFLYHRFYGYHVLYKMDKAFDKGEDPAAQIAMHSKTHAHTSNSEDDKGDQSKNNDKEDGDHNHNSIQDFWVDRPQQKLLDEIISGKIIGRYFLIIGEKGTGKTSLIMEAMKKVNGLNVCIFDAHADPEIFRLRLGKALNFTFSEDYIGSLFSIRGPRDTTALLDIERAFSKLEELAINRVAKTKRPLVMIINNAHLIKENEEGVKLLELLQQKAEALSGAGLLTMIFNSDDYWVYEKLKQLGTRLELINVRDLNRKETVNALKFIRHRFFPKDRVLNDAVCNKVYDLIGGRPQHITQVARHNDIVKACHEIIDREKTWYLNQCGLLGSGMDDDVMESGKFSSSAMLLMREFVEMDRQRADSLILSKDNSNQHDHYLPELPLWRARQVMTRADYIQRYDNLNIFTIDSESRVRADSVPMMRAFHEIASQPHFDELLEDTMDRVADIESLGRTREIVMKDLNMGSEYLWKKYGPAELKMTMLKSAKTKDVHGDFTEFNNAANEKGSHSGSSGVGLGNDNSAGAGAGDGAGGGVDKIENDDDDDDEELYLEDIDRKDSRKWWKRRMNDQLFVPEKDRHAKEGDLDLNRVNED